MPRKKKQLQRVESVEEIRNNPYIKRLYSEARLNSLITGVQEEHVICERADINVKITDDDGKEKTVGKSFILPSILDFEGMKFLCEKESDMYKLFNYGHSLEIRRKVKGYVESDTEDIGTFLNKQVNYMVDTLGMDRDVAVGIVKESAAYKAKLEAKAAAEKEAADAEKLPESGDSDDEDEDE